MLNFQTFKQLMTNGINTLAEWLRVLPEYLQKPTQALHIHKTADSAQCRVRRFMFKNQTSTVERSTDP